MAHAVQELNRQLLPIFSLQALMAPSGVLELPGAAETACTFYLYTARDRVYAASVELITALRTARCGPFAGLWPPDLHYTGLG
jgi:hypothetical protein